ncbi:MAG TPA: hypothetical protein VN282_23490 [Pyrinomonadaceae bacterium]|nr:hypothetical protein [Pyrinomonadaceae bacterium]
MTRLKKLFTVAALLATFLVVGSAEVTATPPSVNAFISGNNSGPVQGSGYACMSYGSLNYMWMTLQGPSGTEEWSWQDSNPHSNTCQSHTLTASFQYDSDYFLTVFACGSDDNGSWDCASDTKSFRTPPQQPGDPDPPNTGGNEWCYSEPCPYVISISPQPVRLGDSGILTVTGWNLQNIVDVWFNVSPGEGWSGGPSIQASVISATPNEVLISYYVPYNPSIYNLDWIILRDNGNPQAKAVIHLFQISP